MTKVLEPELVPKGVGLGFFTISVLLDQRSNRLPFFDDLALPSTRNPLFLQTGPPNHQIPQNTGYTLAQLHILA